MELYRSHDQGPNPVFSLGPRPFHGMLANTALSLSPGERLLDYPSDEDRQKILIRFDSNPFLVCGAAGYGRPRSKERSRFA